MCAFQMVDRGGNGNAQYNFYADQIFFRYVHLEADTKHHQKSMWYASLSDVSFMLFEKFFKIQVSHNDNKLGRRKKTISARYSQFLTFHTAGKRSSSCFCKSSGDPQLARHPSTPGAGSGQVCLFSGVHMYVHFSTLATSFGSVLANTLKNKAYFYFLHVT